VKILVIGGMHGNEMLGINLVQKLQKNPIKNVDALIANPRAVRQRVRFCDSDLNRSFGNKGAEWEAERANELVKVGKKYDLVLDFHNTTCPNNDCGFVGDGAKDIAYSAAALLGLNKVIVADYDCINKALPNCLSVEISTSSGRNSANEWYELMAMLVKQETIDSIAQLDRYRFVHRITLEDRDKFGLEKENLRAFEPLPEKLAQKLGISRTVYPIFIGDKFTPYNYGGLVERIR
jgi:hypothetical protein